MVRCAIGVDLGGQSVKLAVVDAGGVIRGRRQAAVDAAWSASRLVECILHELDELCGAARADGFEPAAAGMVMPGYMDRERTRLRLAANLPKLSGTSFLSDLRAGSPLDMAFDADSNAAALAEARFGAGREVERLIVAAIGTGIGAGVVLDGEILRIREHIAGSLGHVIVDATGPRCGCGARGCVEALAAGPALERRAGLLADADPGSQLALLRIERGRLTGVEIAEALDGGDAAARQAVDECGWWLGAAIASWSVVFLPDKVLLAGGVAMLGEPYLTAVRKGFADVAQPGLVERVHIERAALGADAGAIGAAATVMPR